MKEYTGKSACGGIAVGEIAVYKPAAQAVRRKTENPEDEVRRFRAARAEAENRLDRLYEKALKEVGKENAEIFEIHKMMLEDADFSDSIEETIRSQGVNAEFAVQSAGDKMAGMFSAMDDEYMRGRAADVKDIAARLVEILSGNGPRGELAVPSVVTAEDLAPSETLQMDKSKILAFVTSAGSINSHTAILARTMNIPAVVDTGVEISDELDGKIAVVDGNTGKLYIDPTPEVEERARQMKKEEEKTWERLRSLRGLNNVTVDGRKVLVYANIGNITDIPSVRENDAGGIGLFRSEFVYMESSNFPTEEEQFEIYKEAAERMEGKRVIIRTLDIGADKQAPYFGLKAEENPAMGLRAIRICLKRPEILKTQLRALYRAASYGRIAIMYPMITSVEEVMEIKAIAKEVSDELTEEGVPIGNPEQGIMIETPAAAVISDLLAPHVDFFSIGTNDLSQYALAIDRQNADLDEFFNSHHIAVLRMIETTIKNAHSYGKWVGICGELAADLRLTETFLKMGVDELSVSPGKVLPLREKIRNLDLSLEDELITG